MPRTRSLRRIAVTTLIGAAPVVGVPQVAPDVIVFRAGDPIEADRMYHDFVVLDGRIDAVSADVAAIETVAGPQGPEGLRGHQGETGAAGLAGPQRPQGDVSASFGTTNFGGDGRSAFECTLGEVRLTAATFGYGMVADGRPLPISTNAALLSLPRDRQRGQRPDVLRAARPAQRGAAEPQRSGARFLILHGGRLPHTQPTAPDRP